MSDHGCLHPNREYFPPEPLAGLPRGGVMCVDCGEDVTELAEEERELEREDALLNKADAQREEDLGE